MTPPPSLSSRALSVLDAACANAKFAYLFHDDDYTGVDIDDKVIAILNDSNKNEMHRFFAVDLVADLIPNCQSVGGYDLVLSTHTLSYVPVDYKKIVIQKLFNSLAVHGWMILQVNSTSFISSYLDDGALIVKRLYYKGIVSRVMERFFSERFHKSFLGAKFNHMLSFIDFGKDECIYLIKFRPDGMIESFV